MSTVSSGERLRTALAICVRKTRGSECCETINRAQPLYATETQHHDRARTAGLRALYVHAYNLRRSPSTCISKRLKTIQGSQGDTMHRSDYDLESYEHNA